MYFGYRLVYFLEHIIFYRLGEVYSRYFCGEGWMELLNGDGRYTAMWHNGWKMGIVHDRGYVLQYSLEGSLERSRVPSDITYISCMV